MDNIWKLCGLELNDILIQQDFNFIGKESDYYTGEENIFIPRDLTVSIQTHSKLYKLNFCNYILLLNIFC
jgi:hypothetical protein